MGNNLNKKIILGAVLLAVSLPLFVWQWPNLSKLTTPKDILKPSVTTLACPVAPDICSKATKQDMGLGWKLATGSSILAAFDGTLNAQNTFGGKNPPKVYILTNSTNTYQAGYVFITEKPFTQEEQESLTKGKKVKKGDVIAKTPGITLDDMGYKNLNIIFYIVDIKKKERIDNLSPKSFGNLILP